MKSFFYKSYLFFSRNKLTGNYLNRIKNRMEIYNPGVPRVVRIKTMKIVYRAWGATAAAFGILCLFGDLSAYYLLLTACVLWILHMHVLYQRLELEETKLLKQFERFLADVRYHYGFHGMADEAVIEAADAGGAEIGLHGELIYHMLKEEGGTAQIEIYREMAPHPFFVTFYALCESVIRYGDKKVKGRSVFLTNLGYLKDEVNVEMLKRQKIEYLFTGLLPVAIAPVFAVKPIELWAVRTMEGMNEYYRGVLGLISTILVFGTAIGCYRLIHKLRYEQKELPYRSHLLERLMKVRWIDNLLTDWINRHYAVSLRLSETLKEIGKMDTVKEFYVKQVLTGITAFLFAQFTILQCIDTPNFYSGYRWSYILISILVGLLGMMFPKGRLILQKQIIRMKREEEVIQFQTVILMLMHMEQVSVEIILQWLESFASAFKGAIASAVDRMEYEGMETLIKLREQVNYEPFTRLVDGLLACDKVPVFEAFDEIESDRNYYLEKHKQENEALVNDKAVLARTIAFVPLFTVTALKIIIPFVMEGLSQLSAYTSGLESLL